MTEILSFSSLNFAAAIHRPDLPSLIHQFPTNQVHQIIAYNTHSLVMLINIPHMDPKTSVPCLSKAEPPLQCFRAYQKMLARIGDGEVRIVNGEVVKSLEHTCNTGGYETGGSRLRSNILFVSKAHTQLQTPARDFNGFLPLQAFTSTKQKLSRTSNNDPCCHHAMHQA